MALTLVLFLLSTRATSAATQSVPTSSLTISTPAHSSTSSSQAIGSSSILHPTQGETIVYGSQYTIQWTPPAIPGSISMELWDDDQEDWASSFNSNMTYACDGWLVNSQCGKIATNVSNSGHHVWNVSSTLDVLYQTLSGNLSYYLAIYIQQSDHEVLSSKYSPWYVTSGVFMIAPTNSTSASTSASSSGSDAFLPLTTLSSSSETRAGSEPAETSSTGTGARIAMDQLGWGILGLINVLAMW
ncbi:hypothetical protein EDB81DRAFT_863372 [Dactylonectria macrodidyma]|uniref:Uncharacterized protein n=1 Tax=Dactylonectria macrodidyma TaxID=307937 RepID=A0A9P9CY23_9HYPO|nr:hypothetical protein EDB81DRAFT_863372 [Dactylonectria macrodidyma]